MARVPNLTWQNKLAMFKHHRPTNTAISRKSHSRPAQHPNPTQETVMDPSTRACQAFDKMSQRNVKSATALIGHFAKHGLHGEAFACFLRMLFWGIRPNEYTFGTLVHSAVVLKDICLGKQIHCHAKKVGLDSNMFVGSAIVDLYAKLGSKNESLSTFTEIDRPNVVTYSTLIRAYLREGEFDEAQHVFGSMPEKNVVSWNTMISGCSQSGRNEEAVNFFIEMLREGYIPSQHTYPCAIISSANIGALGMGKSIHACAFKFLGDLGLFLANSLISFYAKCGSMEDSLLVFEKTPEKNIVSWNAVICGYAQNGRGNCVMHTYRKMKILGFKPNSVTILGLLWACNHAGLVDEGYKHFNEAKEDDPSLLKAEHYACMIDLLSRSARFSEAKEFLRDLPFDPGVGFWKALLSGCHVHSNSELGEVAARKILELDPRDVSSYVMLSNVHSAAGRWGDVLRVRRMMRKKGLDRVPGCSWIEVRSKIHVFVTADKSHGQKNEIYRALGIFLKHLRYGRNTNVVMESYS